MKTAAREFNICHMILSRFIKKLEAGKGAAIGYKKRRLTLMNNKKKLWQNTFSNAPRLVFILYLKK
jgi:hypothetical protein